MFVFIPIRTDSPVRRLPYVNYTLIGVNILVFLATDFIGAAQGSRNGFGPSIGERIKDTLALNAADPRWHQFISYQFLHGDTWHLFGNMLFLWIFGNSVNSKLGNLTYLVFYLASGVFAALGYIVGNVEPMIGASGAIAGVTTGYLALFPRSEITIFYWLWFYIGTMHIQAMILIGVKIILWDNLVAPSFQEEAYAQVAYAAHLSGYFFGLAVSLLLLAVRAVPRDQFDILALIKRGIQRHQLRAALSDPNARAQAEFGTVAQRVSPITGRPLEEPGDPRQDEMFRRRGAIGEAIGLGQYAQAAEQYLALIAEHPEQCLARQHQLAVANQLAAEGRHREAAEAYEKFLQAYPVDPDSTRIKLLLGIINAKYLQRYDAAQQHLRECLKRLSDPAQIQQAQRWLQAATGGGNLSGEGI